MPPNHALQRTRRERRGCNRTPAWAGSLSLGLGRHFSPGSLVIIFRVWKFPAGVNKGGTGLEGRFSTGCVKTGACFRPEGWLA